MLTRYQIVRIIEAQTERKHYALASIHAHRRFHTRSHLSRCVGRRQALYRQEPAWCLSGYSWAGWGYASPCKRGGYLPWNGILDSGRRWLYLRLFLRWIFWQMERIMKIIRAIFNPTSLFSFTLLGISLYLLINYWNHWGFGAPRNLPIKSNTYAVTKDSQISPCVIRWHGLYSKNGNARENRPHR